MSIYADFSPKIIRRFLLTAGWVSLPFVITPALAGRFDIAAALAVGLAVGTGDNAIMLGGIVKGSKKNWGKAFALMKRNMLERLVFVGAACFLAIKAGTNMLCFFAAFFLMHTVCLVFLANTAREVIKNLSAERSEKYGSGERDN